MYICSPDDLGNKSLEGRPQTHFYKSLSEAEKSLEMSQALTDMISISGFKFKMSMLKLQKNICQCLILLDAEEAHSTSQSFSTE